MRSSSPAARSAARPRSRRGCRRASTGSPRTAWPPRSPSPTSSSSPASCTFLEALRIALRIAPLESEQHRRGRARRPARRVPRRSLPAHQEPDPGRLPRCSRCARSRAAMANDEQRFKVRDFFAAIPDLALSHGRARRRALSRVPPAARAGRAGVRRARARRADAARSGRSLLDGRLHARRRDRRRPCRAGA